MIIGSVECDEPSKDVLMAQEGVRELSIGKYMNCFHWLPMRIIRGQDAKLENQLGCEYLVDIANFFASKIHPIELPNIPLTTLVGVREKNPSIGIQQGFKPTRLESWEISIR